MGIITQNWLLTKSIFIFGVTLNRIHDIFTKCLYQLYI